MIMEIFSGSFQYAFKDKGAVFSVIKLGILSVLSFFILPIFLTLGFSYRTIFIGLTGSMSYNNDPIAKFNDLGKMFVEGLKVFFVTFIYFLPTILVTIVIIFNEIINLGYRSLSSFSINFDFSLTYLISLALFFISFMFVATAIPHMINNNGSISYAFKIKDLVKLIKYTAIVNYLKFFIISLILFVVFTAVAFILSQSAIILLSLIHIAIYSVDFTNTVFGYLNVFMFLIFFLFSMGIYNIIESRGISFLYNEDGLEE